MTSIDFSAGTLEVKDPPDGHELPIAFRWDTRSASYRAPALAYADAVRSLTRAGIVFEDRARRYVELEHGLRVRREPRPFQAEALAA